jgi:glycosyltransferase involved in cell wall biosynthesis
MSRERVYILLLAGELEDAKKFLAARYPDCEHVMLSKRELRESGWWGQVKSLRALKGRALVLFRQSLNDSQEPQLAVWSSALHRCCATVLADASGRYIESNRWKLIFSLPKAVASALADMAVFVAAWLFLTALRSKPVSDRANQPETNAQFAYLYPFPLDMSLAGGAMSHVKGFLGGLAAAGATCEVFSGRSLPIREFPVHVIPATRRLFLFHESKLLSYNVRFALAVRRFLRERRGRVLYQRHGRFVVAGALLSALCRLPLILEYNGSETWVADHWDPSRFRTLVGLCEEASLSRANVVVVVSEALRQELLQRGVPEERIVINPNGVDPVRFQPGSSCGGLREQLGLQDSDIVIGFVGTFHYWHGVEVLERAILQLFGERTPEPVVGKLRFLLMGDGLLCGEMKSRLKSYEGNRVFFTGIIPHEQIVAYLDSADILVSPHVPMPDSRPFFGSPTKIFEYMAMGKGIIASNLDQLSSVLKHGQDAWLVEPGDPGELASAIVLLAGDSVLRKKLGQNARATALARHTWRQNAERVLAQIPLLSTPVENDEIRTKVA